MVWRATSRIAALLLCITLLAGCMGSDDTDADDVATSASTPIAPLDTTPSATSEPTAEPTATRAPTPDLNATAAATGCEVTPFSANQPDDPDFAEHDETDETVYWYEGDGLWADADLFHEYNGNWYAEAHYVFWYSEETGVLEVSATSLDNPDAGFEVDDGTDEPFVTDTGVTLLKFSEPGCWEVTGTISNPQDGTVIRKLTLVVYVLPLTERPDHKAAIAQRESLTPWPVPADCAVTPFTGPGMRNPSLNGAFLEYWLPGDGLTLTSSSGLLFEGENALAWYPDEWQEPQVTGHLIDNASISVRSTGIRTADQSGEYWRSTVVFTAPGCWELRAEAGDQRMEATVYVYPADCRPTPEGTLPDSCTRPAT